MANERIWAEKAYRALARSTKQRPVKMTWILDAMEAGEGPELAQQLKDHNLPPRSLPAIFISAALESGAMRVSDPSAMPGKGVDRDDFDGIDHLFTWANLAAYLEPVTEVMSRASSEVFSDYMVDLELGEVEEFHDFPLRELLQEAGIKVEEFISNADPLTPTNDTDCGQLLGIKFDGVKGHLEVTTDGFLFVPADSAQPNRREGDEAPVELKYSWPGTRWWAWEEATHVVEKKPGHLNEAVTGPFYIYDQTLPYEIQFTTPDRETHVLKWTYFTRGKGFKDVPAYLRLGIVKDL